MDGWMGGWMQFQYQSRSLTHAAHLISLLKLKVVVYPSYNDIHDIFLSEISSQRRPNKIM